MEYLVDAYNLLHAGDSGDGSLQAARERLLDALADFHTRTGSKVTAVFDGIPLPHPDRGDHQGVKVRFSRTPEDADRLLARILEASDHTRETTVVSSDRAVRDAARAAGARVLGAEEFRRRMSAPERASGNRQTAPLSRSEVLGWAKAFGVDPEAGAPPPRKPRR